MFHLTFVCRPLGYHDSSPIFQNGIYVKTHRYVSVFSMLQILCIGTPMVIPSNKLRGFCETIIFLLMLESQIYFFSKFHIHPRLHLYYLKRIKRMWNFNYWCILVVFKVTDYMHYFRRLQVMTGIFNLKNEHKWNLTNKNIQKCQIHKINATADTKICTDYITRIFARTFHTNSLWQTYNKKILQKQVIHIKISW